MSDEVYSLDLNYLWDAYPNGVEGAHSCIAMSLASIIQAESFELTGLDDEAYFQIITNHVVMLDVFCMKMLKAQPKAPVRAITKKEKK